MSLKFYQHAAALRCAVVGAVAVVIPVSVSAQSRGFGEPYAPPPAAAFAPMPADRQTPPPYGAGLAGRRWDGTERRPDTVPYPATYPDNARGAGGGPAIWSGLYGGINGGYHWDTLAIGAPFNATAKADGGLIGAHLGYVWQWGHVVAGLEFDASARGGRGHLVSGSASFSEANRWSSSARARAGYAHDNWMIYATAGLASGGFRGTSSTSASASSDTLMGLVWGAGAELKLTSSISTRLEVLRTNFRETSIAFSPGGPVPLNPDTTTVRAGITFHLN